MFCAYNDYLHITAKTLPFSYRIKDDSNFASCTSEIAAIALQFLLGEQTKAEPLIRQVPLAKLEILFANTVFLQTDCKQNYKRDGYNYLCTNTIVCDILFADFRF